MSKRTEVTKVVENVDRLFSEIVVNSESHVSDRYVPPEPVDTPVLSTNQSEDEEEQTAEQNDEPVQGEYVKAVELNNVLHDFNDEELAEQVNEVKGDIVNINGDLVDIHTSINNIGGDIRDIESDISDINSDISRIDGNIVTVQSDIGRLNNRVATVEGGLEGAVSDITDLQNDVDDIEDLIPNQATPSNQLADKDFVNSSIATNTANFLGTYTSLADIEAIPNPTNNDYAFLQTTDQAGNTVYKRYKYSADTTQWLYEYDLNNSSFTAEQWATINSGLTQNSVDSDIASAINDLDVASVGGNGKYIKSISQVDGKIVAVEDYLSATGGGVAFIGTRAQYEVAKLIPLGQTGHIPSGALVIITDEDDYLNSEDR